MVSRTTLSDCEPRSTTFKFFWQISTNLLNLMVHCSSARRLATGYLMIINLKHLNLNNPPFISMCMCNQSFFYCDMIMYNKYIGVFKLNRNYYIVFNVIRQKKLLMRSYKKQLRTLYLSIKKRDVNDKHSELQMLS